MKKGLALSVESIEWTPRDDRCFKCGLPAECVINDKQVCARGTCSVPIRKIGETPQPKRPPSSSDTLCARRPRPWWKFWR